MYLVIARSAHDDIPVRLYSSLKDAKIYASANWDKEACEDLYKDVADVCNTLNIPPIENIFGIEIIQFKNAVPAKVRWKVTD